jgi:hypothetical protein
MLAEDALLFIDADKYLDLYRTQIERDRQVPCRLSADQDRGA